jgi:hypothetical protein
MSLLEIEHLLIEFNKKDNLDKLDQAYYISQLVLNEKIDQTYSDFKNAILGVNMTTRFKQDFERYKIISKRLGLKYPGREVL